MARRGDAAELEELGAPDDGERGHWVSSEVQEELQRCVSRRRGHEREQADDDDLELVVVRRRHAAMLSRFVDADGDLDPPRAKKPRRSEENARDCPQHRDGSGRAGDALEPLQQGEIDQSDCFELLVRSRTPWQVAGAQVWRAALLLTEFVEARPELFADATVLELGCGVGLASIVVARVARRVFATDADAEALALAQLNATRNCWPRSGLESDSLCESSRRNDPSIVVAASTANGPKLASTRLPRLRVFDWGDSELPWRPSATREGPGLSSPAPSPTGFSWTRADAGDLGQLNIVIASDVLYDEETAHAFLCAVRSVLLSTSRDITVVVAIERRPVFSLSTMSVVALGYDVFLEHLCLHNCDHVVVGANRVRCHQCTTVATTSQRQDADDAAFTRFVAREYPVSSIPHVLEYDRPSTLMVWIIDAVVEV